MTPTDFGLGVLASWLANKLDGIGNNGDEPPLEPEVSNEEAKIDTTGKKKKLFRSFDVFLDLEEMVNLLEKPVAYLLIETEPTTHYQLVALVLESQITKEWYLFRRGRMAFQGSGGGHHQAERAISIFKKRNISVSVWVVDKKVLDEFESGYLLWKPVFESAIPFRAAELDNEKWQWIKARADEMISER